jgi:D-arginine dehydrogenase
MMAPRDRFQVVVVGAGIAGAAVAWFLAEAGVGDVLVLEREEQPGSHASGRSAAVLVELDPNPVLQRLKMASAPFLRRPPPSLAGAPLVEPSGILLLADTERFTVLAGVAEAVGALGVRAETLSVAEAVARVPVLEGGAFAGAVALPEDGRIDVHALLSGYLAGARRRGAEVRLGVPAIAVRVERGRAVGVQTPAGPIAAQWVVDAAGAWAGQLAEQAGASPIRLAPLRRCLATFAAPPGIDARSWPLCASDHHRVYFGPESGGLKVSPMDEEPMAPCDARPDEAALAGALARLALLAPALVPRTLRRRWAGLRTFAPDRVPVVGEDPRLPGFFWLAGQGGCGIETSPVLGRVAADLIVRGRTDAFDAAALAPGRFGG